MIFAFTEFSFDPSNLRNPITRIPNSDFSFEITPSTYIYGTNILKKTEVIDSKIDFFNNFKRDEFYDFEYRQVLSKLRDGNDRYCTPANAAILECDPYFFLEFRAGGTTVTLERRYRKLLDTLGDIGGVFEIMIIIGSLMFMGCRDRFYREDMRRIFFGGTDKEVKNILKNAKVKNVNSKIDSVIDD